MFYVRNAGMNPIELTQSNRQGLSPRESGLLSRLAAASHQIISVDDIKTAQEVAPNAAREIVSGSLALQKPSLRTADGLATSATGYVVDENAQSQDDLEPRTERADAETMTSRSSRTVVATRSSPPLETGTGSTSLASRVLPRSVATLTRGWLQASPANRSRDQA
jgi:hypothetical protein